MFISQNLKECNQGEKSSGDTDKAGIFERALVLLKKRLSTGAVGDGVEEGGQYMFWLFPNMKHLS